MYNDKELNNDNSEKISFDVGFISFKVPITLKEAKAIIKKPSSRTAKEYRQYFQDILTDGCRKMISAVEKEKVEKYKCK